MTSSQPLYFTTGKPTLAALAGLPAKPQNNSPAPDPAPVENDLHMKPQNSPNARSVDNPAPVVNTIATLARGIINTSNNKDKITIMLVGETGTGKTSVLSLLVNVMAGRPPAEYDLVPYDVTNEQGGQQFQSQTNAAKVYKFESLNGIQITVLDTPGLADTRGIQKDKEHKDSIAAAIQENIQEVTAVIILANGTTPRLGVATDYAITTLTSIFPATLANNICLLFTNVASPLSWNFKTSSLPVEIQKSKRFLLDNPIAMRKNYLDLRGEAEEESEIDDNAQDILDELEASVNMGHQNALKMLLKLFTWLDTLEPQATTEIISLYDQSMKIERSISGTLARMTQLAERRGNLERLIKESNGMRLTVKGTQNFRSVITKKTWILKDQSEHSTLCGEPQCYSNCHVSCTQPFSVNPKGLRHCWAFRDGEHHLDYCRRSKCGHPVDKHHHYNSIWFNQEEEEEYIDAEAKKRHEQATAMLKETEISIGDVRKIIENTGQEMVQATQVIGRLAASYSELSLSGSFSGQVKKSVKLLETHLEGIRNKSDPKTISQIEASLDQLRNKLRVLEVAQDAAKNKISRPTIMDRLGHGVSQGVSRVKEALGLS